jgi:hypothetical protein
MKRTLRRPQGPRQTLPQQRRRHKQRQAWSSPRMQEHEEGLQNCQRQPFKPPFISCVSAEPRLGRSQAETARAIHFSAQIAETSKVCHKCWTKHVASTPARTAEDIQRVDFGSLPRLNGPVETVVSGLSPTISRVLFTIKGRNSRPTNNSSMGSRNDSKGKSRSKDSSRIGSSLE